MKLIGENSFVGFSASAGDQVAIYVSGKEVLRVPIAAESEFNFVQVLEDDDKSLLVRIGKR